MAVHSTQSTRLHYSYIDKKNGRSFGFIDLEDINRNVDNGAITRLLKGCVAQKWQNANYTDGIVSTIEFIEYE